MTISGSMKRRTDGGLGAGGWGLRERLACLVLVAFTTACGVSPAADWPLARGDAAGTGVASSTIDDQPQLLWKYAAEESSFEASPVIAGGVVYIGDADGTIHAVRLEDGKQVWTKSFDATVFAAAGAFRGDRFYVGDIDGVVRSLATSDGEQQWEFATESEVFAGPTLHGGALLVTTEGGTLFAIDAADGKERWRFTIEAPLRCSPTIIKGHTLLAGCDAKLHAIDLSNGKEIGAVEIGGQTGCTAALAGERAYFGAESGMFYAVDCGDLESMAIAWDYRDPRRGQGIRTAAAVSDALVVYGSNGKALYGLNPTSGELIWEKPVRSRVESSPVLAGDRVIAATTRGRLMLLNAADGETMWEYDVGGGFTGSPAVVDGRLVIGNDDGTLYCFGSQD